jgi:hypothetical protein
MFERFYNAKSYRKHQKVLAFDKHEQTMDKKVATSHELG